MYLALIEGGRQGWLAIREALMTLKVVRHREFPRGELLLGWESMTRAIGVRLRNLSRVHVCV